MLGCSIFRRPGSPPLTDFCATSATVMDRDSKHCQAFRDLVEQVGPCGVRLPPRSQNLSAHLERFIRSIKEECLDRLILFGDGSLRNAAQEFISHYHAERDHQGLDNRLIEPGDELSCITGRIAYHEKLGIMLRYYYRRFTTTLSGTDFSNNLTSAIYFSPGLFWSA
jgi:hypothetical protein